MSRSSQQKASGNCDSHVQVKEESTSKSNTGTFYAEDKLPRFDTVKYGKHSLRYYGPFLWSKLTQELRVEDSL